LKFSQKNAFKAQDASAPCKNRHESVGKAVEKNQDTNDWICFTFWSLLIKPSRRRRRRKSHSSKIKKKNKIQSLINSLRNQALIIISLNYYLTKEEKTHPPTHPPTITTASKTKNILVQLGNNYHLKPLPVPQPQYKTLLASFLYFSDLLLFLPHFSLHTK